MKRNVLTSLAQEVRDPRPSVTSPELKLRQGVIDAVGSGDVDVTVGGSDVVITGVAYLASYSPTQGDTVWMLQNGSDLLVLGDQA